MRLCEITTFDIATCKLYLEKANGNYEKALSNIQQDNVSGQYQIGERVIMKEILGCGVVNALMGLGIEAECTYTDNEAYEVWQLTDADYQKICNIKDEDWKENWGWWRYAEGTNIEESPTKEFIINGQPIVAWYNETALNDFVEDCLSDDEGQTKEELVKEWHESHIKYDGLLEYCSRQHGASTEKNVCAITIGLAKLNNMTLGELWTKHQG